jgi:hypothetical protein
MRDRAPARTSCRHGDRTRERWWFAAVCATALVAYLPSFTAVFQFDDYDQIVNNPAVRTPTLDQLLLWGRARIIPFATLALNAWIGGEEVFGYHVVNFIVHLLTCFFVYRLALALCETPRLRDTRLARQRLLFAVAAALIVACHPIQVQAVTYIVQRISSMAAMFYVGSVFFYVTGRNRDSTPQAPRHPWPNANPARAAYVASLLFAIGAFFSKESSATLPLMIVLTEWIFYGRPSWSPRLLRFAPFLLLVLAIPVTWKLLSPALPGSPRQENGEPPRDLAHILTLSADQSGSISPTAYFLTQCTVVPRYLGLVLVPWGFNVDHDVPVAHELSAAVIGGFALLAGLFACGLYAVGRWPAIGFGVLWFFLALSIESSVFPIQDVMNEHRMYLAMPGVAFVLASGFSVAARRRPAAALAFGGGVVVLLCALTIARNQVWRTELSLWSDALDKSPEKSRVHVNVGIGWYQEGRLDEAIRHYCRALAIDPKNRRARYDLNAALDAQVEAGEADVDVEGEDENGMLVVVPRDPCPRP